MKLTKEQVQALYATWVNKETLSLTTNFAAPIQLLNQTSQKTKQDLKKLSSLATESGDEDPDFSISDVNPQDGDFVTVKYRAISAAMLADRPIDFSNAAVLKRSVKLLNNQTVFKDHNFSVDKWLGKVTATEWDTSTPDFPPGINADLMLDTVKDPMVVRGVLLGAIHSSSVTVSFEWKPSHPTLMEERRFFDKLGEDVDGQIVRLIVTKILRYWEISLVWQGADAFAKQIDEDGNPIQKVNQADLDDTENLTLKNPIVENKEGEPEMKLLEMLKKTFGVDITEENFDNELQKHVEYKKQTLSQELEQAKTSIEDLGKNIEDLKKDLKAKEEDISSLKVEAEVGKQHLEASRQEAIRLCKLAKGESVSGAIIETLQNANLKVVHAWTDEFQKEVDAKYPAKCKKCLSTEISRQSSQQEQIEEKDDRGSVTVLSPNSVAMINKMHG